MDQDEQSREDKIRQLRALLADANRDPPGTPIRRHIPKEAVREPTRKRDMLRERLDQLNRAGVKDKAPLFSAADVGLRLKRHMQKAPDYPSGSPEPIVLKRDRPSTARARPPRFDAHAAFGGSSSELRTSPVRLSDAVDGREVQRPDGRTALLLSTDVRTVEDRQDLCRQFENLVENPGSRLHARLRETCGGEPSPGDLLFMDIETTGLSNVPLFLIGVMCWEDGSLWVKQFLARTYAEEAAVIGAFVEEVRRHKALVTFNGKSFDVPYIRTRAVGIGVPFTCELNHIDLLHEGRRAWKQELPNCKLQTLEVLVCGHSERVGDIPGAEIGEAYHAFVRNGDARQMVQILTHNMLDLVTLAEILMHLP